MKKVIYVLSMIMVILFCTGCGKEDEEKVFSFTELKQEIHAELEEAKNGKYENLNIVCDGVRLPESEQLKEMRFPEYGFTDGMSLKEKANFYEDIVYPKLLDVEDVKAECFKVHITSLEDGTRIDGDYTYLLEHTSANNLSTAYKRNAVHSNHIQKPSLPPIHMWQKALYIQFHPNPYTSLRLVG